MSVLCDQGAVREVSVVVRYVDVSEFVPCVCDAASVDEQRWVMSMSTCGATMSAAMFGVSDNVGSLANVNVQCRQQCAARQCQRVRALRL